MHVVVLGAGIIGLSCTLRLLQAGYKVTVIAKDFSPHTTSDGAGGFWEPYKAEPQDKVLKWSESTKLELLKLEKEKWPVFSSRVESCYMGEITIPFFKHLLDNYKIENYNRAGYTTVSWSAPLVNTTAYMNKLMQLIVHLGGKFVQKTISDINELIHHYTPKIEILINCLGFGSKELFNDQEVIPIRGVLVLLEPIKAIENRVFVLDDESVYVISRTDKCLLGGTAEEHKIHLHAQEQEIQRIIEETCKLVPEIKENGPLKITNVWVGLRPYRTSVRLEIDNGYDVPIVHCYGHGGSGWTVHWGCADDVLKEVKSISKRHKL